MEPKLNENAVERLAWRHYNDTWDGEWYTQWDGPLAESVQEGHRRSARTTMRWLLKEGWKQP